MAKIRIYLIHWMCQFLLHLRDFSPAVFSIIDTLTLYLACLIRGFKSAGGSRHAGNLSSCRRPLKPLELYDLHPSPYCGRVRHTLQYLELDHIIYPCPKESFKQQGICINSRFRPRAKKLGGKCQFPLLVDPNKLTSTTTEDSPAPSGSGGGSGSGGSAGLVMYESRDIINYLWREYGDKAERSLFYRIFGADGPYYIGQEILGIIFRPCLHMGIFRAPSRQPEQPLELYGYDGNPNCLRVQESLATLELPYKFIIPMDEERICCKKLGCNSKMPAHSILKLINPIISQPILKDPNSGIELKNSLDIVKYLQNTYQTAPVPAENWLDYSPN